VAFLSGSRDIIKPAELAWVADASGALLAIATRPMAGTAEPGEKLGTRGEGRLRHPAALCVNASGSYVVDANGRLDVLRGASGDSLRLTAAAVDGLDVDVGITGLVYVLCGAELRVYSDPPREPLWACALDPELLPASAITVSSRGEVYVVGRGKLALEMLDFDAEGKFGRVRGARAATLGVGALAGAALTPPMLLPVPGREGWAPEDRYLVVSDPVKCEILVLETRKLNPVGRWPMALELADATPGKLDVSNRGQIAVADSKTGVAYALPTRILASLLVLAPDMRWRDIPPDSTGVSSGP
jgi:hypothetical protein